MLDRTPLEVSLFQGVFIRNVNCILTYLTESLIVKKSSVLTAEVTESEALVGFTVLDVDVGLTDLDLTKCDWIGSFWFAGGREKGGDDRVVEEGGGREVIW